MGPCVSYISEVNCTMSSRKTSLLGKLADLADAVNQVAYLIIEMFLHFRSIMDSGIECDIMSWRNSDSFFLFLTVDRI
jgi:hypothetical protein